MRVRPKQGGFKGEFSPFTLEVTFETIEEATRLLGWVNIGHNDQVKILKEHYAEEDYPGWKVKLLQRLFDDPYKGSDYALFTEIEAMLTVQGYSSERS